MRLQAYTEYAIRILQYLHVHRIGLQSGVRIAEETGVSYQAFMMIAVQLRRAGLLISVRGPGGGFQLGRPAEEISFYDVFLCIEKELCISRNLNGEEPASDPDYKVHEFLRDWQDKMVEEMSGKTIAELAS